MDNIFLRGKKGIISGIEKTTAVVKGTYGAAGGNVILEEDLYPYHSVRNDGKAIVDKIKLADPVENIGAQIMKEVGDKADKDSGDGRKTTMILTEAIFNEAKNINAQPMEIKRSLDECFPIILEAIDKSKKEITIDDIKSVATISSESEEIGQVLYEIYKEIGKEGIVEIDSSGISKTFYEITEGVKLRNAGYISPYCVTEYDKAVIKNPKILICKDSITNVSQIEPLVNSLAGSNQKELVIYCDEIDNIVANVLALNHIRGVFKTTIIKSPTLWKDWLFEDFAKITGATIIDTKNGKTFQNITLEDLGTCEKLIVGKDETRVIGIKDVSEHIKYLEESNDNDMKLRASWLNTKVAILKVGANSESELSHIIKKAKDACHASYLALKDGVVAGGGVALLNIAKSLRTNEELTELKVGEEIKKPSLIGVDILYKALQAPFRQLCKNAGVEVNKEIKDEEWSNPQSSIDTNFLSGNHGLNIKTLKIVDMFEAGIIDPALVIKNAVKSAVSVAGIVLTSSDVIILPQDKPKTPII